MKPNKLFRAIYIFFSGTFYVLKEVPSFFSFAVNFQKCFVISEAPLNFPSASELVDKL